MRREPNGKNFLKFWICNEFCHYESKCPKREKKSKVKFKPRRPRNCLYANEDEIIWKILKTLTPPFKKTTQMIEQVIPCTEKFTR